MQMAASNISGYSNTAYIEINPPILDPPITILKSSEDVKYLLLTKGISSLTIYFKYAFAYSFGLLLSIYLLSLTNSYAFSGK